MDTFNFFDGIEFLNDAPKKTKKTKKAEPLPKTINTISRPVKALIRKGIIRRDDIETIDAIENELKNVDYKTLWDFYERTEKAEKVKKTIEQAIRVMMVKGYVGFKIPWFKIEKTGITPYDVERIVRDVKVKGVRVVFEDGMIKAFRL